LTTTPIQYVCSRSSYTSLPSFGFAEQATPELVSGEPVVEGYFVTPPDRKGVQREREMENIAPFAHVGLKTCSLRHR
jgi:hypothetical protein